MEKSKTLSYTEMRELSSPENVEKRSAERRTKAIEDYRSAYEAHEFWRKEYEKEKNPTTVQEFQKTKQRLEVTIKRLDQLGIDTLSIVAREGGVDIGELTGGKYENGNLTNLTIADRQKHVNDFYGPGGEGAESTKYMSFMDVSALDTGELRGWVHKAPTCPNTGLKYFDGSNMSYSLTNSDGSTEIYILAASTALACLADGEPRVGDIIKLEYPNGDFRYTMIGDTKADVPVGDVVYEYNGTIAVSHYAHNIYGTTPNALEFITDKGAINDLNTSGQLFLQIPSSDGGGAGNTATLGKFWVSETFVEDYGLPSDGLITSNNIDSMSPLTDDGFPNFNFITGWTSVSYERYGLE